LKNLIYAIHLDPSTRQELDREARRVRYAILKQYIVAPLVAMCKRTVRRLCSAEKSSGAAREP
jgi:hypothetical protein